MTCTGPQRADTPWSSERTQKANESLSVSAGRGKKIRPRCGCLAAVPENGFLKGSSSSIMEVALKFGAKNKAHKTNAP